MTDREPAAPIVNPGEIAQAERIGLGDLAIAALVAVIGWMLLTLWKYPGLLPSVWNEALVASGGRPAATLVPGFWRLFAASVYACFGTGGELAFRLAGRLALAAIAVGVYMVLRETLAFMVRARPQYSRRRTLVMRIASAIGATAFVSADPVWNAGQCFTEDTLLVLLTLAALEFFFLFLRKGVLKYAYLCALSVGLLSAETPAGVALMLVLISLNLFVLNVMPAMESPFFKPAVIAVGKWHMTFIYIAAFLAGITINAVSFALHDGLSAVGETVGSLPLAYALAYWGRITGAADLLGWVLLAGLAFAPLLVTMIRFPVAADEESFLSYSTGMVFLACGVLAVSQSCALPSLWFWNYGAVHSQYLLSLGSLFSATTLAGAVTILGVDALCRNHQRLARQYFGDESDDDDPAAGPVGGRFTETLRRTGIAVVPALIVLTMLPGRMKVDTKEMLELVGEAVRETVDEAGAAKYLFTDGNLDAAVELESRRRGGALKCLSLMASSSPLEVYLRTAGVAADEEDLFSFRFDAGMGLRTWIRDKPARLAESAVQVGFDLWKRDGKALPPLGGLLSLPGGFKDEATRADGVIRARRLAERMLAVCERGGVRACTDPSVRRAFAAVQWRLARLGLYRAELADLAGDVETAAAETELANRLNAANEIYQGLVRTLERRNEQLLQRLTPREGLQLALVRADFRMGRVYAELVLSADPENPDANFALGMYYLGDRQFSRAEVALMRCLIRKPDEAAVYNNLAMVQLELGKLDAAEFNVQKALALAPDATAVLDTRKRVSDARRQLKSDNKGGK